MWCHITKSSLKNLQMINDGEGVERKVPSYTGGEKCKFVQPLSYGGSSKNWQWNCNMIKQSHSRENPHIPHPGKIIFCKDRCTPMFIAALFTIATIRKQPKHPLTEEWIKKWYIYAIERYSAITKNEIEPFMATWMDLETVIPSDVRQKKTNIVWHRWYVGSKTWHKCLYLQNRNTHRHSKLIVTKGEKEWETIS